MQFQRPCLYCSYEGLDTNILMESDKDFENHMRTAHIQDGKYYEYLTTDLGVTEEAAQQTIDDIQNQEPPA